MSSMIDFYAALGVEPSASPEGIRAAYAQCKKRRRPAAHKLKAVELFEEAQAEMETAFAWLSDPERRIQFDQMLDNFTLAMSLKEDFKVDGKIVITRGQRKAVALLLKARALLFQGRSRGH